MKQVFIRKGQVLVEEVPAPVVHPGTVLVRNEFSCISTGTELSGLKSSSMPLWQRALKEPHNLKKGLEMIKKKGFSETMDLVKAKVEGGTAVGYSCSGLVVEVGEGVSDLFPGDLVACAGAGYASHAEVVCVPCNLVTPLPSGVSTKEASTVTLGAIAMQGVRRASPTLGEVFVVFGLGLLGQITVQILKASGCQVMGLDTQGERVKRAMDLGLDYDLSQMSEEQIFKLTQGNGVDGVIITASSSSSEIVSHAFRFCRKKGRVVLVGDVGLNLDRGDLYIKELDFFISTSYGPGRYDDRYEIKGLDYPVSHVRWTENRNMAECLRLIRDKKLLVTPLIGDEYEINDASRAYEVLKNSNEKKPLAVLLKYPKKEKDRETFKTSLEVRKNKTINDRLIKVGFIGSGGFARAIHLPNFSKQKDYEINTIVSRSGHNATNMAKLFKAAKAGTKYEDVLDDKDIDLVVICTRHNLHGEMTKKALLAGKHVFVEKPLALGEKELDDIKSLMEEKKDIILLTGFNRRFSPHIQKIKESLKKRQSPIIINYTMNAGYLPKDHWVHGEEGGGRNKGEACHIYDLFTFLTGQRIKSVQARSIESKNEAFRNDDNFVASFSFENGSLATLTYTALGHKKYPKESMTLFFDNHVVELKDYCHSLQVGSESWNFKTGTQNKGHLEEIVSLAKAIRGKIEEPIPLWQQFQATSMALEVEKEIFK